MVLFPFGHTLGDLQFRSSSFSDFISSSTSSFSLLIASDVANDFARLSFWLIFNSSKFLACSIRFWITSPKFSSWHSGGIPEIIKVVSLSSKINPTVLRFCFKLATNSNSALLRCIFFGKSNCWDCPLFFSKIFLKYSNKIRLCALLWWINRSPFSLGTAIKWFPIWLGLFSSSFDSNSSDKVDCSDSFVLNVVSVFCLYLLSFSNGL